MFVPRLSLIQTYYWHCFHLNSAILKHYNVIQIKTQRTSKLMGWQWDDTHQYRSWEQKFLIATYRFSTPEKLEICVVLFSASPFNWLFCLLLMSTFLNVRTFENVRRQGKSRGNSKFEIKAQFRIEIALFYICISDL